RSPAQHHAAARCRMRDGDRPYRLGTPPGGRARPVARAGGAPRRRRARRRPGVRGDRGQLGRYLCVGRPPRLERGMTAVHRAVAAALAADGMAVLVTDLDAQACDAVAKEINAAGVPGRAAGCALDVTDAGDWARAMRLARRFGAPPRVLVNNAGAMGLSRLG